MCSLRAEIGAVDAGCTVLEIGHSLEGRSILAIELRAKGQDHLFEEESSMQNPAQLSSSSSSKLRTGNATSIDRERPREKAVLVLGGVHAREWTTTTSVLLSAVRVDVTTANVHFVPCR